MFNFDTSFIKSLLATTVLSTTLLTGCVYKIDIAQGTPVTAQKAAQVQLGMSQNQIIYLLGTPALKDPLNPNRWDYLYDYTAGTDGKRAEKPNIKNARQYLKIYFDGKGTVIRIDGANKLPKR